MRVSTSTTALMVGAWLSVMHGGPALAQPASVSEAECRSLRQQLAEHSRLSEGVRRAVIAQAGAAPAATPAPSPSAGRAEAIRARLEQIPRDRQALEEQRLGAMMRLDLARASQIQSQLQALDVEKANLERERAALPASPPAAAAPSQPAPSDPIDRIRCEDVKVAVDNALKTRRRELGARDDQAGALPLMALKGQTAEQIARELAAQFATGPAAGNQIGLLDADGNGQLDGFVDVPAPGIFRLVRQRSDGTLGVEVFQAGAPSATPAYAEMTRRLDEMTARQTGQGLVDLLATRPAGPARAVAQTTEFPTAYAQLQAGNFTDAARLSAPAARSAEFPNLRGQTVRVLEIISPLSGGLSVRRVIVLPQPNDQEVWEETTTTLRPTSYWRTDVEVARSRQTRTTSGAVVGAASAAPPVKFALER